MSLPFLLDFSNFSYCSLPILWLANSLFNPKINDWKFSDNMLNNNNNNNNNNKCLINNNNKSFNLIYLWLCGMDNNIFSYIYIRQRNFENDNIHAIFQTIPKEVNKFYNAFNILLLRPGSDASYCVFISDITTVTYEDFVVVSNAWYESETLRLQKPSDVSGAVHVYTVSAKLIFLASRNEIIFRCIFLTASVS